jgi:glycosyltransferase involved in cell wall biosynthesis
MVSSTPQPPWEGIGFYVWNLSQCLARLGHRIQIITRGSVARTTRQEVAGIPIWRTAFLPVYPWHVHLHGMVVDRLLQKLERDIDLIHVHTPLVKHPRSNRPVLVTVHTPMKSDVAAIPANSLLGALAKLQGPVSYVLERQLFERASRLTCVAHSVARELGAYGVAPSTVAVMGNGTDTELFSPAMPATPGGQPYFLTVSRLAPRKGMVDLVRCAEVVVSQVPAVRFLIAGSGPLEGQVKREIRRRRITGQVRLLGHVASRKSLVELYRGATAFIHPAHYEGLPTVLLEAMSCACPSIATSTGGAPDVIDHRKNGLLVPPGIPRQLAAAALELLRRPEFALRLGLAARRTVEARYSWHVIAGHYLSLYQELL